MEKDLVDLFGLHMERMRNSGEQHSGMLWECGAPVELLLQLQALHRTEQTKRTSLANMWRGFTDVSRRDDVVVPEKRRGHSLEGLYFGWSHTKQKQDECTRSCCVRAREPSLAVGAVAELVFLL